jgi:hypothetical protein
MRDQLTRRTCGSFRHVILARGQRELGVAS